MQSSDDGTSPLGPEAVLQAFSPHNTHTFTNTSPAPASTKYILSAAMDTKFPTLQKELDHSSAVVRPQLIYNACSQLRQSYRDTCYRECQHLLSQLPPKSLENFTFEDQYYGNDPSPIVTIEGDPTGSAALRELESVLPNHFGQLQGLYDTGRGKTIIDTCQEFIDDPSAHGFAEKAHTLAQLSILLDGTFQELTRRPVADVRHAMRCKESMPAISRELNDAKRNVSYFERVERLLEVVRQHTHIDDDLEKDLSSSESHKGMPFTLCGLFGSCLGSRK